MPKKSRRGMDSELAAICENGKPEAPQRFTPWGGRGIGKGAKPSSPLVWNKQFHDQKMLIFQLFLVSGKFI
ncbi:hypothetical protein GCM10007169_30140 [Shewanella fodinae]|nr:hypothetical protein GCM10007169_30140 [Shewanella fodinae]